MSAPALDAARHRDDHRFGASPPLSLGVEEELLLVDEHCRMVPAAEQVLEALGPEYRGRVSTEIFATQIELKTGICLGAGEAVEELTELRQALRATGIGLLGAGLHPDDDSEPQLVAKPRYNVVKRDLAGVLDTPPCGLHVHVGMPDPETAIQVANALRYHLPLVQALSANSPFREGADTGLASARSAAVASYPRFEVPRSFRDYDEFLRVADQLIVAAGVADYTYLWWDVRPHPRLGTVEVRGMDVQADVATNVAIAVLIQALAAKEIDRPSEPGLWREAIEESSFQANRHGLSARLMVDEKTTAPARQLGRQRLAEAGEYARQLGGAEVLAEIEQILDHGNGADVQRGIHADGGIQRSSRTSAAAPLKPATRANLAARVFGRRQLQAPARRGHCRDGRAAGFGDDAVAAFGAPAHFELDQGGAAQFRPRFQAGVGGRGIERRPRRALAPTEQAVGAAL